MADIMEFKHIEKSFDHVHALKSIHFSIPEHSIFGLLGPNGAGKTTLIRLITKILAPDSGEIYFEGKPIQKIDASLIGYMPEEKGMYKKMKVGEHLIYLARLKGMSKKNAIEKIHLWFEKLEIKDWWDKKIEDLSKGMQQKVQFISTVLHEPKLLILDEPFSGLDPVNADLIKNEIYLLHKNGTTILFSTHRMEQVEEICNHIVLIHTGNVILNGQVANIKENYKKNIFQIKLANTTFQHPDHLYELIKQENGILFIKLKKDIQPNDVLRYFLDQQNQITLFEEKFPSLHEIFISTVKENTIA